jgi:hypothetical protein
METNGLYGEYIGIKSSNKHDKKGKRQVAPYTISLEKEINQSSLIKIVAVSV